MLVCISLCMTGVRLTEDLTDVTWKTSNNHYSRILPFFDSTFNPTSALVAPALDPLFKSNFTTQVLVTNVVGLKCSKTEACILKKKKPSWCVI